MYFTQILFCSFALWCLAECGYNSDTSYLQGKQKLPVILMHKQALAEDGAFNYAFAGDNGIKQGETIQPDGTRVGAYSYVDPNGETVSVKYTAGKDGFQILQGDHVPKASAPVQQAAPYYSPPASRYPIGAASDEVDDFGYGPTGSYSQYRGKINFKPVYHVQEDGSGEYQSAAAPVYARTKYQEPEEQHSGPHSFGGGYSFEFGSGH